jgi:SAM-dependent methyltransferase
MTLEKGALEGHFDARHAARDDPWGLATKWYEIRKRRILLASLPEEALGRVLEIGCSVGITTIDLASRSESVLALDVSSEAVQRAGERLAGFPNVEVRQADVTAGLPGDGYDLVVLSEVGYYLSSPALERLLDDVEALLTPRGVLAVCHWRYDEGDFAQTGDDVHRALAARGRYVNLVHHVEHDFVLDVVSLDGRSVAERTGLR